jgi:hypothetical protein
MGQPIIPTLALSRSMGLLLLNSNQAIQESVHYSYDHGGLVPKLLNPEETYPSEGPWMNEMATLNDQKSMIDQFWYDPW